jgi:hypothetical protein
MGRCLAALVCLPSRADALAPAPLINLSNPQPNPLLPLPHGPSRSVPQAPPNPATKPASWNPPSTPPVRAQASGATGRFEPACGRVNDRGSCFREGSVWAFLGTFASWELGRRSWGVSASTFHPPAWRGCELLLRWELRRLAWSLVGLPGRCVGAALPRCVGFFGLACGASSGSRPAARGASASPPAASAQASLARPRHRVPWAFPPLVVCGGRHAGCAVCMGGRRGRLPLGLPAGDVRAPLRRAPAAPPPPLLSKRRHAGAPYTPPLSPFRRRSRPPHC